MLINLLLSSCCDLCGFLFSIVFTFSSPGSGVKGQKMSIVRFYLRANNRTDLSCSVLSSGENQGTGLEDVNITSKTFKNHKILLKLGSFHKIDDILRSRGSFSRHKHVSEVKTFFINEPTFVNQRHLKIFKVMSLAPTSPAGGRRLCEEVWSWVGAWTGPRRGESLNMWLTFSRPVFSLGRSSKQSAAGRKEE